MTVLDLILNHDNTVQLLWEMRCDCAEDRNRLLAAVYAHGEDRQLYLPSLKGRHAATGVTVRRAPRALRMDDGGFVEIAECGRCHNHFTLTSAPVSLAYLVIRMGLPAENPYETSEYVKTLQVPFDAAAVQVLPGLFLTPLGKGTYAQVAPA